MDGKELFPFQSESVEEMCKKTHTLLAHEPGLGKTPICIRYLEKIKAKRILIVCPASVKRNWFRELNDWLKYYKEIQILDKRTDQIQPYAQIIIVNYDLVTHSNIFYQLKDNWFDIGIFDEAHYLKNMKAKRTHAILSKNGLVRQCKRTVMVTGTPVLNRPIELFPILKVLSPQTIVPYNDYWRYAKRFCDAWQNGFTLDVRGASHTDDLNKRLRAGYMIRKTVKEVFKELPPVRYQMLFLSQTKDVELQLRQIEDAQKKDFNYLRSGLNGGQLATVRRETAEKKVELCMEQIRTFSEESEKLVIFVYHHSIIDKLQNELKDFNPVVISGDTPNEKRQEKIENFQKDKSCRIFIAQIQSAGQGIDGLQKVCNRVLFIEWSWVPGEIEQAVKRLARIGQTESVLAQFMVWENSIEEHQLRIALDKREVIKQITK